jgi:thiamine biosynthesis protein ThiS
MEPKTILVNGRRRPLRVEILVDLLVECGFDPRGQGIAVAVDGNVVRRVAWSSHRLRGGEEIDVVGAVQGG